MSQQPEPAKPKTEAASPLALPGAVREAARVKSASQLDSVVDTFASRVLPRPKLLRNEEILLEIHQAWYRYAVPAFILRNWWAILILTGIVMLVLNFVTRGNTPNASNPLTLFIIILVLLVPILLFVWAFEDLLHYNQWRLFVTNRRTILYVPDPRSWLLLDSVRLQAGKIQVIDTSFSSNLWWGLFQSWFSARDLVISLSGYEFKPHTAEVKGGLIFPDVTLEDIMKLEEIVFPKK